MIYGLVVLTALFTSVFYARYITNVAKGHAGKAAIFDLGLMLMTSLTTQAWFLSHSDIKIFLLYDAIAALGTYYAVKSGGSGASTDSEHSNNTNSHLPCE